MTGPTPPFHDGTAPSFPTGAIAPGSPLFEGLRGLALDIGGRAESILRSDLAFDAEGIHALRIATKRLRAYWQLVKPLVDREVCLESVERLRDSARVLAGERDEHVLRTLLLHLATTAPEISPHEVERATECIPPGSRPTPADHRRFLTTIEGDVEAWKSLDPVADDEVLDRGFRRAYSKTRKLGRRALDGHDPRRLHRWRRWVKYLRYQVEPFAHPERVFVSACRSELDQIGSILGERNDYHNLASALEGEDLPGLDAAVREGEERLDESLPTFENSLFALGTRSFLAELGRDLAL